MINLSTQEQKQINGGDYRVRFYYWENGMEDRNMRKWFSTREEAEAYKRRMEDLGYDETYKIYVSL